MQDLIRHIWVIDVVNRNLLFFNLVFLSMNALVFTWLLIKRSKERQTFLRLIGSCWEMQQKYEQMSQELKDERPDI